jgi:hypothetical protein
LPVTTASLHTQIEDEASAIEWLSGRLASTREHQPL